MTEYIPQPGDEVQGTITGALATVISKSSDSYWRVDVIRNGEIVKETWRNGVMKLRKKPSCQFCGSLTEYSGKYHVCTECFRIQEK